MLTFGGMFILQSLNTIGSVLGGFLLLAIAIIIAGFSWVIAVARSRKPINVTVRGFGVALVVSQIACPDAPRNCPRYGDK